VSTISVPLASRDTIRSAISESSVPERIMPAAGFP
jgi:hypothetical protein